jgi:hypothetical protein
MASLYARGWRQGSILVAELPLDAVVLSLERLPGRQQGSHDRWVLASQDCDLDQTDVEFEEPTIELRPVYQEDAPTDWGIRSARVLLTESEYVVSTSPRTIVAAAAISALVDAGAQRHDIPAERRQAFKTWLGLRYDRPAVPPSLVPLAKRIAGEVQRPGRRPIGRRVRDVLMQFDTDDDPVRFSLFAVLEDDQDEEAVREWLAAIAQAVPIELGIGDEIEAATAARISLHLIETSYAADVTQLTWRPGQPEPEGAT